MEKKYIDETGLVYFWAKILKKIPKKTSDLNNDSSFINDASAQAVSFTPATERTNISTGETIKTVFGKLAKWYSSLGKAAWSNKYSDLDGKPTIPSDTNQLANGAGYITLQQVQAAINDAVGSVTGIKFLVVENLPPEGGQAGTIYLKPRPGQADNSYEEYIWLSAQSKYEKIGDTSVDLSDYQKASELIAVTTQEIDTITA